jgi:hypothetical protein
LQGTRAEGAGSIRSLFGKGQAELAGRELRLVLPPQSLSIYALE